MHLEKINPNDDVPVGSKVIHRTTLEVGEVIGESMGWGKCKVKYPVNEMWYPQPKRNIMLIIQDEDDK